VAFVRSFEKGIEERSLTFVRDDSTVFFCHFERSEKSFPLFSLSVGARKLMNHFVVQFFAQQVLPSRANLQL
jgi:hypothetical protein